MSLASRPPERALSASRTAQIEAVIQEWLSDPGITLICGDWPRGSIMEIVPEGKARLTPPRYPAPFSGLRDLVLDGQGHHLHLDLEKLSLAVYSVVPSVCYGYRPSFEVHFTGGDVDSPCAFAMSVTNPYRGANADTAALVPYFRRMLDHHRRYPEVTRFRTAQLPERRGGAESGWREALSCLEAAVGVNVPESLPPGPDKLAVAVRALVEEVRHA